MGVLARLSVWKPWASILQTGRHSVRHPVNRRRASGSSGIIRAGCSRFSRGAIHTPKGAPHMRKIRSGCASLGMRRDPASRAPPAYYPKERKTSDRCNPPKRAAQVVIHKSQYHYTPSHVRLVSGTEAPLGTTCQLTAHVQSPPGYRVTCISGRDSLTMWLQNRK